MKIIKRKGFTLIELIAVLVIMAILSLIVIPLVMSIIRKAKTSADKRSIDAYGRSIELAIAGYLLDNGTFPTSIDQITIEYSGDKVVCSTTQINSDSSVYLADCRVGGRSVDNYTYGKYEAPTYQEYSVGDQVTYNNVNYYVIADSSETEEYVTMLKAEPLTVDEVNNYHSGHANRYTYESGSGISLNGYAYTVSHSNIYGGVAYYSSETCGYVNGTLIYSGCITDYASSDIKYIVDAWANDKINSSDLVSDETGYSVRLITIEELRNNLGYGSSNNKNDNVPNWVYLSGYYYWTMSKNDSVDNNVWYVGYDGILGDGYWEMVYSVSDGVGGDNIHGSYRSLTIRPVITLKKSAL